MRDVLIVDDESSIGEFCKYVLQAVDCRCELAADGLQALEAVRTKAYDLVLLDVDMPGMKGHDLCRHLRQEPPCAHLKIIMMSGRVDGDDLAAMMMAGADDYLAKPLSVVQLQARVRSALRLKHAQDRSAHLNQSLLIVNRELERNLTVRDSDLVHARNALVLALAELVGYRDCETGAHLHRLQRYCRCLAEGAAGTAAFAGAIDDNFIDMLECCAPLHDIGKVGLPDHILLKAGKLTTDERIIMQTHTAIGADTLQKVADRHGFARGFLEMAVQIARHHHERYDGQGYPDRLLGDDIPLAARIVTIADVYDALRSRRVYKPALSHDTVTRMMATEFVGHFDPALMRVFDRCAVHFKKLFSEMAD